MTVPVYKEKHLLSEAVMPSMAGEQETAKQMAGIQKAQEKMGQDLQKYAVQKGINDFSASMTVQMENAQKSFRDGMHPLEVKKQLQQASSVMLKAVSDPQMQAQFGQAWGRQSKLTMDAINEEYTYQEKKKAEDSFYQSVAADQEWTEGNSMNLFSSNPSTSALQEQELIRVINAKDHQGRDIYDAKQKQDMYSNSVNVGDRNHFDSLDLAGKKRSLERSIAGKVMVSGRNVDSKLVRSDVEATINYKKAQIKKIEEGMGEDKAKRSARAYLDLDQKMKSVMNMEKFEKDKAYVLSDEATLSDIVNLKAQIEARLNTEDLSNTEYKELTKHMNSLTAQIELKERVRREKRPSLFARTFLGEKDAPPKVDAVVYDGVEDTYDKLAPMLASRLKQPVAVVRAALEERKMMDIGIMFEDMKQQGVSPNGIYNQTNQAHVDEVGKKSLERLVSRITNHYNASPRDAVILGPNMLSAMALGEEKEGTEFIQAEALRRKGK